MNSAFTFGRAREPRSRCTRVEPRIADLIEQALPELPRRFSSTQVREAVLARGGARVHQVKRELFLGLEWLEEQGRIRTVGGRGRLVLYRKTTEGKP